MFSMVVSSSHKNLPACLIGCVSGTMPDCGELQFVTAGVMQPLAASHLTDPCPSVPQLTAREDKWRLIESLEVIQNLMVFFFNLFFFI